MRPLRRSIAASVTLCAVLALARAAGAAETATSSVAVTATFASRTSLRVSTQILEFEIATPGGEAVAVVDFSAGARTRQGGDGLLTVEAEKAMAGPGGAADAETSVSFSGDGDGALDGTLATAPSLAGRWTGSGRRSGRVTFALRASAPGTYTMPVRFVLSTP